MANTNSLENLESLNFEVLSEYISTGSSKALSKENQKMVDICIRCYGLLSKFPQRSICIKRLMALHPGMSYKTAARYVDFTRKTWGNWIDASKEFLCAFFINAIMADISDPKVSDTVRAKNLATLGKYIASMPDKTIDPKLMEANKVYIQINVGEGNYNIPEKALDKLPTEIKELLMHSISNNITDEKAFEILDS